MKTNSKQYNLKTNIHFHVFENIFVRFTNWNAFFLCVYFPTSCERSIRKTGKLFKKSLPDNLFTAGVRKQIKAMFSYKIRWDLRYFIRWN